MVKAVIKSTKMFNFPYVVHVYDNDVLQYGKNFNSLLSVRAFILSNNIDKFVSML